MLRLLEGQLDKLLAPLVLAVLSDFLNQLVFELLDALCRAQLANIGILALLGVDLLEVHLDLPLCLLDDVGLLLLPAETTELLFPYPAPPPSRCNKPVPS